MRPGVAARRGIDFVAAGAENQVDLVVGSKESLCLSG